ATVPPPPAVPTAAPAAEIPSPEAPPTAAEAADSRESLAQRGVGLVTVNSLASYANVYVMFTRYGKVGEPLEIPCGKRFISVGVPWRGRPEPIWLAPGRMTVVPCGGSIEMNMNPRALRKPAPAFNPTQL